MMGLDSKKHPVQYYKHLCTMIRRQLAGRQHEDLSEVHHGHHISSGHGNPWNHLRYVGSGRTPLTANQQKWFIIPVVGPDGLHPEFVTFWLAVINNHHQSI